MRLALGFALLALSAASPLTAGALRVASVGGLGIDAADFERRARLIAPSRWLAWGATWEERRRRFLDEVLVAEALLDVAATKADPRLQAVRDSALARSLAEELESELAKAPLPRSEVEAYYELNRREFEARPALHIWRILVREEKDARELISQLRSPNVADFSRLARDRSLDDATFMRAGNLGFVDADGHTDVPELRVAKVLFEAASQARDGELVKEPVPENGKFAVVWRRASRPARREKLEDVSAVIERRLREAALSRRTHELIERLRREGLRDHHPELAGAFEPPSAEPEASRPSRAAAAPTRKVRLRPEPGDHGLR